MTSVQNLVAMLNALKLVLGDVASGSIGQLFGSSAG